MESRLHTLIAKMKELEQELALEIQKREEEYYYKIFGEIAGRAVLVPHQARPQDDHPASALRQVPGVRRQRRVPGEQIETVRRDFEDIE